MSKGLTATRCLLLLAAVSAILLFSLVPRYELLQEESKARVFPRQLPSNVLSPPAGGGGASAPSSPATTPTTAATTPTTSAPTTPTTTSAAAPPTTTTSAPPSTTSSAPPTTSAPPTSQPPTTSFTPTVVPVTSNVVTTNSDGQTITDVVTASQTLTSAPSASTTAAPPPASTGLSTSTIVGMSVAGGVAVLGIVAFFVWKFTRKRFDDEFDDSEAIKWPELNNHGATAPPTTAGRALGTDTPSDTSLSRANSGNAAGVPAPGYANSIAASSTADLYPPPHDPYAVPPLPHMNPNQPYRDDPAMYEPGYYDPYRGPIPQTFNDTASEHGAEAIPMTQLGGVPGAAARSRSPGPQAGFDMGGRNSPSLAGRRSPGPQAAYGYGDPAAVGGGYGPGGVVDNRARSPGPGVGLGMGGPAAGRRSPGPQAAYDTGYGPR
ncbi:hypothetical protein JAAARDRAFT_194264 [Jaapia argillacea MUCL 33604]|uniref:Mid2 domain-containing protein n=1 Tax=Jaapia argillacea MUCL 33604 TaxID=933084 RepID=A0A067PQP9_9AGAM|nr:hypothetical protein JAAARDRAFT_194264 [Jaapia argillacea MUCL 33604]